MKRMTTRQRSGPSTASLREMPEIDFSAYRIQRNPYAARIRREGSELKHHGPSAASLKEMPEADFARSRVRRNKYPTKARAAAMKVQYGKGRPQKGAEVGPTPARSVRLPKAVWKDLEIEARERATTVHALLRELVLAHVSRLHRLT